LDSTGALILEQFNGRLMATLKVISRHLLPASEECNETVAQLKFASHIPRIEVRGFRGSGNLHCAEMFVSLILLAC
jgi:hypothetical protein